jgi:NADH-quinone oxidoreductase subunit L
LAHLDNKMWVLLGLFGAFLTSYYTFRVIFVMLFPRAEDNPVWEQYWEEPEPHGHGHDDEAHGHDAHGHDDAHGSHDAHGGHGESHGVPWVMSFPLLVLAAFTLILGFMQGPLEVFLLGKAQPHDMSFLLLVGAVGAAFAGIGLAWLDWGRKTAAWQGFLKKMPALETFFIQKWYMDHFWRWFLNTFIYGFFSKWFTYNDRRVVDGGVDAVAFSCIGGGRWLSFIQTAFLQYNLLFMVLVLAAIGIYLLMGR